MSHETMFERIFNNKKYRIYITSDILQILKMNRIMLIKLMKYIGMNKDEILEFIRNPEDDIKEILFDLNYGSETEKKYCPECNELMFPIKVKRIPKDSTFKVTYKCRICGKEFL